MLATEFNKRKSETSIRVWTVLAYGKKAFILKLESPGCIKFKSTYSFQVQ